MDTPSDSLELQGASSPEIPELTIVIPAIDEQENLELLLPALWDVLKSMGIQAEIVVVDGGSTDGTEGAALGRGARVVRQTEQGYGGALLAGFAAARSHFVLTMDA